MPILWDKEQRTIVNNESPEIIRMLNTAFDAFTNERTDYYPAELRGEIDAINKRVYRERQQRRLSLRLCHHAGSLRGSLPRSVRTLDWLEERLSRQRYLAGDRITEADWRLFTTLLRFDAVYYGHFKCNLRRIADYPNLSNYLRDLYQSPGVADTVNIDHIKRHYYMSHAAPQPEPASCHSAPRSTLRRRMIARDLARACHP